MKCFLLFVLTVCSIHAQTNPLTPHRLKEYYANYLEGQKQKLALLDPKATLAFWVSPNGNDANYGTKNAPFLTLERARDAARALPESAFRDRDVYIYLEDGTYRLQKPFLLDERDSGKKGHNVVYSAAPGAHPILSGAIRVKNWAVSDFNPNIYVAKISPCSSRQLYVNQAKAERAQTALYPSGFLPQWTKGGIEFVPFDSIDPNVWTNLQDIEAVIETQWKMMRVPIQTISSKGLITLQEPAWTNANVYFDPKTNLPGEWSFWQVARFENALEFLNCPGQWYLDRTLGLLYYYPLPSEDLSMADVEIPILETLILGHGNRDKPLQNIRFVGLTFSYATWNGPSTNHGYVADQSGQLLVGDGHSPNYIGHDQNVVPTPGNLFFTYANHIVFYGNIFEHLGGVGLQFGPGCSNNTVDSNLFTDISSSALEIGSVTPVDAHPNDTHFMLSNHRIENNLITHVSNEYVDAAAIFVGFTQNTIIIHNTIFDVPWSGIAIGWGWGLLDVGSFPGLPNATSGIWGTYSSPTPNRGCKILHNKICNFLNVLWDGGAIYTTGQQGPSLEEGLLIEGNVACRKLSNGGGNIFYTDGGSRYILLRSNASYNNPIGKAYFGPPPKANDPFFSQYPQYYRLNGSPYGSDTGGCHTYGDIEYEDNYWLETPIPQDITEYNEMYYSLFGFYPYVDMSFFDPCPCGLSYKNNKIISSMKDIPESILSNAGVQTKPPTIPQERWQLPPD